MNHPYTNYWLPSGEERTVTLPNQSDIRYIITGQGPTLILLHTLRTQLDAFQSLIPLLTPHFTVYAIDLPGHGYSSTPDGSPQNEPFFRESVQQFIQALELQDITLVGESIGGTLALTVAAYAPDGIRNVYAINPYDYGETFGGGIRRSRFGAIIGLFSIFRGFTLEAYPFLWLVISGGVKRSDSLPKGYVKELYRSGSQKGYRHNEYTLFKNWRSWLLAKDSYVNVKTPVTLVYGSDDWSRSAERTEHQILLPNARFHSLPGVGHFASLEAPDAVANIIIEGTTSRKAE